MLFALEDTSEEASNKDDEEGTKQDAKDTIKDMKLGSTIKNVANSAMKLIADLVAKIKEFFAKKKRAKEKAGWKKQHEAFKAKVQAWEKQKAYTGGRRVKRYNPINVNALENEINNPGIKNSISQCELKVSMFESGKVAVTKDTSAATNENNEKTKTIENGFVKTNYILEPQNNVVITRSIYDAMKNVIDLVPKWMDKLSEYVSDFTRLGDRVSRIQKFSIHQGQDDDAIENCKNALESLGKLYNAAASYYMRLSDTIDEAYVMAKNVIEFCYNKK